ncbi:zn-C2H2_12 domain-containing protein [Trichonephila clavata]|uniref:Zn-C2H2_12 domain-containing protein n=1 Tax=Trichonephila clavata TaxID=2740835 RepID=A0A8X6HQU9_TRICU|nr:zn-C2H2_12 domain-containing protein [Trichonephila clavata]
MFNQHKLPSETEVRAIVVSVMEVIDNSTQLKESENQSPEINYCRIPRDVNFGVNSSARNKGETDISLLVACKVQLSSEVIRWKTEALCLQKGHELAQQKSKELDQVITKLSERTAKLEDRLFQAENENKFLKTMSMNVEEEKANLIQRLSQNLNKYHSYSWSELSSRLEGTRLNRLEESESKKNQFSPQEDWREVSQKMLQQMKNEMKELQEMSFHFASDKEVPLDASDNENTDSKEEVEKDLSNLISETVSLKRILLDQRQKLKTVLQSITSGVFQKTDKISHNKPGAFETLSTNEASKSISSTVKTRMTEEDYRLHFMKQLENTCDIKKVQPFLTNPKACGHPEPKQDVTHSNSQVREDEARTSERKSEESEKVCPICNITFDASVSQIDFEEHVLNHLETESASLLDQYVVV